MSAKTYIIVSGTPNLGQAGDTVDMHPRQARYWLCAGVLSDPAAPGPKPKPASEPEDAGPGAKAADFGETGLTPKPKRPRSKKES